MDKADYPRCKTCKWWGPDRGELFRWCSNPVNRDFRGENPAGACDGEELGFDTGPDFGCVHWEAKEEL